MSGSSYERELRSILGGDRGAILASTKTTTAQQRAAYLLCASKPFLVIRGAGSLGVDLVALRGDFSFPIEVKSSRKARLHFSSNPRLTEQYTDFVAQCERSGVVPLYAYRIKGIRGDSWRIFAPELEFVEGMGKLMYDRLPKVSSTRSGNLVLVWDEGMPLSTFLEHVNGSGSRAIGALFADDLDEQDRDDRPSRSLTLPPVRPRVG